MQGRAKPDFRELKFVAKWTILSVVFGCLILCFSFTMTAVCSWSLAYEVTEEFPDYKGWKPTDCAIQYDGAFKDEACGAACARYRCRVGVQYTSSPPQSKAVSTDADFSLTNTMYYQVKDECEELKSGQNVTCFYDPEDLTSVELETTRQLYDKAQNSEERRETIIVIIAAPLMVLSFCCVFIVLCEKRLLCLSRIHRAREHWKSTH